MIVLNDRFDRDGDLRDRAGDLAFLSAAGVGGAVSVDFRVSREGVSVLDVIYRVKLLKLRPVFRVFIPYLVVVGCRHLRFFRRYGTGLLHRLVSDYAPFIVPPACRFVPVFISVRLVVVRRSRV